MGRALALLLAAAVSACGTAPPPPPAGHADPRAPTSTPVAEPTETPIAETADASPVVASRLAGLTYVTGTASRELVLVDHAGEARLIFEGPDEPWGILRGPTWSPDGSQLFVSLGYVPGNTWVMNADGSNRRQVELPPECGASEPEGWWADGASILFSEFLDVPLVRPGEAPPVPGRCILDLVSGEVEHLTPPADGRWLPDGSILTFVLEGDGQVAYLVDSTTGDRTRLLTAGAIAWSPDGKRLAYSRPHPSLGVSELGLADADGSNAQPIGPGKWPTWSRDGRFVAYHESEGPDGLWTRLHVITAEGDAVAQTERAIHAGYPGAVWLPDSSGFVVQDGAELFLVELDGAMTSLGAGSDPTWRPQDP